MLSDFGQATEPGFRGTVPCQQNPLAWSSRELWGAMGLAPGPGTGMIWGGKEVIKLSTAVPGSRVENEPGSPSQPGSFWLQVTETQIILV